MNCRPEDMLVYAVTDRAWLKGESLKDQVEKALKGGVTFVQLRGEKKSGPPLIFRGGCGHKGAV